MTTESQRLVRVYYTVHVNPDDESLARVYKFVKEMPWNIASDPNQPPEVPTLNDLRGGADVGEPTMHCRECGKLAKGFFSGPCWKNLSTAPRDQKVYVETAICIPCCAVVQDSPCFVKVFQRTHIYCKKVLRREDFLRFRDGIQLHCFNCDKQETDGVRYLACNRCFVAYYCSKECQVEGWHKGHKKACYPMVDTRAEYKK